MPSFDQSGGKSLNQRPVGGGVAMTVISGLVIAHFVAAVLIGQRPLTAYFTFAWLQETLNVLLLPAIGWLVVVGWAVWRRRFKRPLAAIRRIAFLDRERLRRAVVLLFLFILVNRAYRALKVAIPRLHEYYADPYLSRADSFLFGTDPWRLTHALIGPLGTEALDALYVSWLLVMLCLFAWIAFARDRRFQLQAAATYFLVWIFVGNVMAVIFASVGPCYYELYFHSPHYAPLMDTLRHTGDLRALAMQDSLYTSLGQENIGSGISAFPSVHVAMTSLLAIAAWNRFGVSWRAGLALAFHLCIFVASVHLGWHYAVDGIASMLVTAAMWHTAGLLLRRGERAAAPPRVRTIEAVPA
jgi:hypothetical protein